MITGVPSQVLSPSLMSASPAMMARISHLGLCVRGVPCPCLNCGASLTRPPVIRSAGTTQGE